MIDQASELRKLVLQSVRQQVALSGPAPQLLVVASGKPRAGVTTVTVNLSVALAEHGARVVVVDADLQRPEVSLRFGLEPPLDTGESESVHRDIHELLQRGPAGIQVVPGLGAHLGHWSDSSQNRLLRQFKTLGRHADLIVLDAGGSLHPFLRRCYQAADDLFLVTNRDAPTVMDTYARIKNISPELDRTRLQLIVNRCDHPASGWDVHRRLAACCQRFLAQELRMALAIPDDPALAGAAHDTVPYVLGHPGRPAARALSAFAAQLLAGVPPRRATQRDAA